MPLYPVKKHATAPRISDLSGPDSDDPGEWFEATPAQRAEIERLGLRAAVDSITGPALGFPVEFLTDREVRDMTDAEFHVRYVYANRPVLWEFPTMKQWPGFKKWGNKSSLVTAVGDQIFAVANVPFPELFSDEPERNVTIRQFAEQTMGPNNNGSDVSYIFGELGDGNKMAEDLPDTSTIIPVLSAELFGLSSSPAERRRNVDRVKASFVFGPALSGSHPHRHTSAWSTLIRGLKRWFIWPEFCHNWNYPGRSFGASIKDWVENELPEIRKTRGRCTPIELFQHPGEAIFVPAYWGHAVINVEPSISISRQIGGVHQVGHTIGPWARKAMRMGEV